MNLSATYWESLCGDDVTGIGPFWDLAVTWETHNPDFTQCFQLTVLQWTPAGLFWLVAIPYLIFLSSTPNLNRWNQKTYLNTFKIVFCLLLALFSIADLAKALADDANGDLNVPVVYFVTPAVMTVTYLLAAVVKYVESNKGLHTSGLFFFFWLIKLILDIIPFRSKIMEMLSDDPTSHGFQFYTVTFFITFALTLTQFLMTFKSDSRSKKNRSKTDKSAVPLVNDVQDTNSSESEEIIHKRCPEETCNFLTNYTHFWVLPTIIKGYRRELKFEDVFELMDEHKTEFVVNNFLEDFQERCNKRKQDNKPPSSWDLVWSLMVTNKKYLLYSFFVRVLFTAFQFVQPLILQRLIIFIQTEDPYQWRGYLYAVIFLVTGIFQASTMQVQFKYTYITGMRMRSALMAAVYRKALKFSNTTRKQTTVGAIVNLMSIDAQKVHDIIIVVHDFWASPVVVVITLILLWNVIGISCLAGVAVLVLLAPLNGGVLIRRYARFQEKQMKVKDTRIRMINQILSGIKVLKMYAWESSFGDIVRKIRAAELRCCRIQFYILAAIGVTFNFAPYMISLAMFTTYVLSSEDNFLDPETAFVTLNLVNTLTWAMSVLPINLAFLMSGLVSIRRLSESLSSEELDENIVMQDSNMENVLSIDNGSFAWDLRKEEIDKSSEDGEMKDAKKEGIKDHKTIQNGSLTESPKHQNLMLNGTANLPEADESLAISKVPETLKGIDMEIEEGKLIAVVGIVGSGKSSLLSSILGELHKTNGNVRLRGNIAYVPQQAWMQNTSLKENVLFGKSYTSGHYEKILENCALMPDLKILPAGDKTEIGEKGINLSGGQKQRISLARAVYQEADIYLLDDPLSAVDAHVGKHLFEKVVGPKGMLKDKTRILVTHAVTYLPNVDSIIVMKNGHISETGTYAELLEENGEFAEFLRNYLQEQDEDEDEDIADEGELQVKKEMLRQLSAMSGSSGHSNALERKAVQSGSLRRRKRLESENVENKKETVTTVDQSKLMTEEELAAGGLSVSVLSTYVKAGGFLLFAGVFLFEAIYIAGLVTASIWLSFWSSDLPPGNYSGEIVEDKTPLRLGVYASFGVVQVGGIMGFSVCLYVGAMIAAGGLHATLLDQIMKAPMSFFDTTPIGRIVNRFSSDMDKVDTTIPQLARWWLVELAFVMSSLIVVSYVTPFFLVVAIPLVVFFIVIQRLYIACIRQLKRMESALKSPIYANFDETLVGVTCVRAYGQQQRFIAKNDQLCDKCWMPWYVVIVAQRWLGFAMECLGALFVFFAALFAVLQKDTITASEAGLSVSYATQIIVAINFMVRAATDLETHIVSVERIKEYTEVKTEANWVEDTNRPSKDWPQEGKVTFDNYSTRYRSGLDLVLRDLSFTVNCGEKLGVVGRTGAGKSSITLAMFRIIEPVSGAIYIDGINVSEIGLHDLRNALTIIPQDPVLFSGTLRRNLDPFDHYSDHDLWTALEHAHLKSFVSELEDGLQHECGEGGEALSVGQRQLVCLGRALLRKTRILILDEATAAVDLETDELIQNTIRTKFSECSVITIAHRLNTIMDYDRVMVLDKGTIVELDSPPNLLNDEESVFYKMAEDAGLASTSTNL